MKTTIQLEEMRFYAYHGVSEQERKVGNDYSVSLIVHVPIEAAVWSDDLSETINYAELYDLVRQEMRISSRLIEHVAGRIVTAIRTRFPQITGLTVTVRKMHPPISGDIASAAIILTV